MLEINMYRRLRYGETMRIDLDKLGQALRHCHDLTFLQNSELIYLPNVVRHCKKTRIDLDFAKALRKELISAAERITRRRARVPIREIVKAIEEQRLNSENQQLAEVQRKLGIPFSRNRLDLARYYAVRLVMEGLSNETVAEFLQVDPRTLANYIAQSKERIRLMLESR
jgi:DNA-binding NarL/FixJ family response regulator